MGWSFYQFSELVPDQSEENSFVIVFLCVLGNCCRITRQVLSPPRSSNSALYSPNNMWVKVDHMTIDKIVKPFITALVLHGTVHKWVVDIFFSFCPFKRKINRVLFQKWAFLFNSSCHTTLLFKLTHKAKNNTQWLNLGFIDNYESCDFVIIKNVGLMYLFSGWKWVTILSSMRKSASVRVTNAVNCPRRTH